MARPRPLTINQYAERATFRLVSPQLVQKAKDLQSRVDSDHRARELRQDAIRKYPNARPLREAIKAE